MSKKKNDFKREASHKKKQTPSSWRKPHGKHSKARLKKKHAAKMPNVGYRTSKDVRGLHPSGFEQVLVHRPDDLEDLEENEAAMIASKVGGKKRAAILEKAEDLEIKVLNAGDEEDE